MTTENTKNTELAARVAAAAANWSGLTWETGLSGPALDAVTEEALASSDRAQEHGEAAVEAAKAGDTEAATAALEAAVAEENQWGDSPTWGPVLRWWRAQAPVVVREIAPGNIAEVDPDTGCPGCPNEDWSHLDEEAAEGLCPSCR